LREQGKSRPSRAAHGGGSGTSTACSSRSAFKYDPFGKRIYKQSPSFTGIFVYDGDNLLETLNATGSELASYTQTQKTDETLAELRGSTTDYYEADGLGSITSLSSSAAGLANTYIYDSFGNTTASTGTLRNYFQYSGREFDSETGIYEYRARYYDPTMGRFISEDPLQFDGGSSNFYVYVGNKPTTFTDPSGLRVLNPNGFPVSGAVMGALQNFNKCIGCDKDVVVTGGDRPASSRLGAGSNSMHVRHLAADIVVPGQLNILTANQAEQCGMFGGIGWYQEGYRGANGEGPHVHVDLRSGKARWGYYADGRETHGYIPFYPTEINLPPFGCDKCQ
jgi:RHS repeat-associated protein